MIDIHSHIKKVRGTYLLDELLADMDRFKIDQRVISYLGVDEIQKNNQAIVDMVKQHPNRLIGCALLNPSLSSIHEDVQHACSCAEIKIVEFNSYLHGYAPDNCDVLKIVFEQIEKAKKVVKVFTGIGSKAIPHQWVAYVKQFPKIPFIFLHMGCFDYGYSCVDIVAQYDNAYIETSNQYEMQILRKAFSQLPKEKIIFGSSYPERFTRNAIEIFDSVPLSEAMKRAYLQNNACTLLML